MDILDSLFYTFSHDLAPALEEPQAQPWPNMPASTATRTPSGDGSERLDFIVRVYAMVFAMLSATGVVVALSVGAPAMTAAAAMTGGAGAAAGRPRPEAAALLASMLRRRSPLAQQQGGPAPPSGALCRICQEGPLAATPADGCARGELGCFCQCRGSLAFVHVGCLERWRAFQRHDRCELCGSAYSVDDAAGGHWQLGTCFASLPESLNTLRQVAAQWAARPGPAVLFGGRYLAVVALGASCVLGALARLAGRHGPGEG